jgi:hypothetical protein
VYFAYVDETGTDSASPAMIMVGIVVNDERLARTQDELSTIFSSLGGITTGHLKELKSKTLFLAAASGVASRERSLETSRVIQAGVPGLWQISD